MRLIQVDVTFHGHDHVYERTCPVYNGTCQSSLADGSLGGPVHVVIGNAGFSLSYLPNPYIPPYWQVIAQPATRTSCMCHMSPRSWAR